MAAYRQVYDSHHLQADCQEPGSAPGPYARCRVWATFTFFKSRQNVLSGVVFVSAEIGTETDFVIGNCHDTYRTKFPSTRSVTRVQVSALFFFGYTALLLQNRVNVCVVSRIQRIRTLLDVT